MAKFKNLIPTIIMLIFELVIGVLLIINGEKVTQVVFILFGVLMLICGSLLRSRNGGELSMSQLVLSIILIGIGAFFIAASGSVMSVVSSFTLIIGIIMAFNGILKLVEFFTIRRAGSVAWFAAVGAIVTIILGLVIAFNPFGATQVMWTVNGILIIVSAVFDIISLIIFGAAMKKVPIAKQNVIETDGEEVK